MKQYNKLFESKSDDIKDTIGMIMDEIEIFEIPYSYFGNGTKERNDFYILKYFASLYQIGFQLSYLQKYVI